MLLPFAIASMLLAVTFYTLGVFSEKHAKTLTLRHVVLFWIGLFFDTTGTTIMGKISGSFEVNLHGVTGLMALILMMGHVIWATVVLNRGTAKQKAGFHKYSLVVWLFWLIPFGIGILLNA